MRRHLPSLIALQCFEASARHLSFTRAGEELCLSQSAVSRQIKKLEAFLGCVLFERVKQRLQLTPVGRDYAEEISKALDQAESATRKVIAGQTVPLRLATEPGIASRWLIPRLPAFNQQYPGLEIELITDMDRAYGDARDYDLAILFGDSRWPGVVSRQLMPEILLAVAHPQLLKTGPGTDFGDIVDLPLLHQSGKLSASHQWFSAAGYSDAEIQRLPGQRFEYFQLLLDACLRGMGVAVLPLYFVQEELESGRLVKACERKLVLDEQYYVVVAREKSALASIGVLVDWLLGQTVPRS